MSYLELNDRVELSSIYADTSNMDPDQFYINNNSLTGSIDKTYLNPPFLTDTSNIYVWGINQQTNKECSEKWENFATTNNFTFGTGSDWDYGYYKIEVRQNNHVSGNVAKSMGTWKVLNKKPIYWNKSPLRFMTYVNSGSFEIGCPDDEYGYEVPGWKNTTPRTYITISKPFFIGRTLLTCDLFNKVYQKIDPTSYGNYTFQQKNVFTNHVKNTICYARYFTNGEFWYFDTSSVSHFAYPSTEKFSEIGLNYIWSFIQPGTAGSTNLSIQALNETSIYMYNSVGYSSSNHTEPVYATRSFVEYFLREGYSINNTNCALNGLGWTWSLPTECQWEYACRAGTSTAFNNGVNLENPYPSTAGTSDGTIPENNIDEVAWWQKHKESGDQIVGLLKPNKWGLFDMHGTAMEITYGLIGMGYKNISGDNYTPDGINGTYAGSPIHMHTIPATNRINVVEKNNGVTTDWNILGRGLRSSFKYNPGIQFNMTHAIFGTRLAIVQP